MRRVAKGHRKRVGMQRTCVHHAHNGIQQDGPQGWDCQADDESVMF